MCEKYTNFSMSYVLHCSKNTRCEMLFHEVKYVT